MGRMTAHPELDVWPQPAVPLESRILCRSSDRIAWLRERSRGVTATDAAKLTGAASVEQVVRDKVLRRSVRPNAYMEHGRAREPHIARWAADHFGIDPSDALYRHEVEARHLATPDGLGDGGRVLAEIKTTTKSLEQVPRTYLRQIWWQQHVLGAERTLFVWEQHDHFVPIGAPRWQWIERDDAEIARLVRLAGEVLARLQ